MAQPIMPTTRTSVKFSLTPRKRNLLLREHSPFKRGRPRSRNWLDLPEDITASIFSRLQAKEILNKCQLVCKTWLKICKKNPLVWRTIDMQWELLDDLIYGSVKNMCRHLIDRSCGSLVDIKLVKYCVDDGLLKHIADSSACGIRRLRLEDCRKITDEGLCTVATSFAQLKELEISECYCSCKTVEVIGRSSPRLVSLILMSRNREGNSMYGYSVARTMPGLRSLTLSGFELTNHELRKILDSCRGLETLDLSHCHLPNLAEDLGRRCVKQITKKLRLPYGLNYSPYNIKKYLTQANELNKN